LCDHSRAVSAKVVILFAVRYLLEVNGSTVSGKIWFCTAFQSPRESSRKR